MGSSVSAVCLVQLRALDLTWFQHSRGPHQDGCDLGYSKFSSRSWPVVSVWGLCTGVLSGTLDEIISCLANVGETNWNIVVKLIRVGDQETDTWERFSRLAERHSISWGERLQLMLGWKWSYLWVWTACWCWRIAFRWPCSRAGMGGMLLDAISSSDIWEGYGKPLFPYSVILSEMESGHVKSVSFNLRQRKQTGAVWTETTKMRAMGEKHGHG